MPNPRPRRFSPSFSSTGTVPFRTNRTQGPFPHERAVGAALADVFDALVATFTDTRMEPDLEDLLWPAVNIFHRAGDRVERELDSNEQAQKRSQKDQDGSKVRSVELERFVVEGATLIERRNVFELMRDQAAELFETHTGPGWRPRAGSMVNRRTLTAAMIDSRDFLAARRRAETEVLLPPGPKVAFAGAYECNDHAAIWAALDRVHGKHPSMVLLHGGSPKGTERIAACWADSRKVPQIAFKPDFNRHKNAAPFKRNDQLLETLPIGVVVFPGSGISDNLADKAKALGIPLFDFRKGVPRTAMAPRAAASTHQTPLRLAAGRLQRAMLRAAMAVLATAWGTAAALAGLRAAAWRRRLPRV